MTVYCCPNKGLISSCCKGHDTSFQRTNKKRFYGSKTIYTFSDIFIPIQTVFNRHLFIPKALNWVI